MKLRRLLAGFVAAAMTIGMIPALVLADDTGNEPEETKVVEATEPEPNETAKPAVKETEKPVEKETEETKAEEPAASETASPAETEEKKLDLMMDRYGGYWRYPHMLDFCYLVNTYYPSPRMIEEMKASYEVLLR